VFGKTGVANARSQTAPSGPLIPAAQLLPEIGDALIE
jgi:hypothetical protein